MPLIVLSLALFGLSIPNLSDQSSLLTPFSIPNLFGLAIGVGGGTPGLLQRRRSSLRRGWSSCCWSAGERDWLSGAGWSTFALIASLAWLMPWYVIWLLPLAALATSVNLRRTALAMTVFLMLAFMPAHSAVHGGRTESTRSASSVGQASQSHQHKLAN